MLSEHDVTPNDRAGRIPVLILVLVEYALWAVADTLGISRKAVS